MSSTWFPKVNGIFFKENLNQSYCHNNEFVLMLTLKVKSNSKKKDGKSNSCYFRFGENILVRKTRYFWECKKKKTCAPEKKISFSQNFHFREHDFADILA